MGLWCLVRHVTKGFSDILKPLLVHHWFTLFFTSFKFEIVCCVNTKVIFVLYYSCIFGIFMNIGGVYIEGELAWYGRCGKPFQVTLGDVNELLPYFSKTIILRKKWIMVCVISDFQCESIGFSESIYSMYSFLEFKFCIYYRDKKSTVPQSFLSSYRSLGSILLVVKYN